MKSREGMKRRKERLGIQMEVNRGLHFSVKPKQTEHWEKKGQARPRKQKIRKA